MKIQKQTKNNPEKFEKLLSLTDDVIETFSLETFEKKEDKEKDIGKKLNDLSPF